MSGVLLAVWFLLYGLSEWVPIPVRLLRILALVVAALYFFPALRG